MSSYYFVKYQLLPPYLLIIIIVIIIVIFIIVIINVPSMCHQCDMRAIDADYVDVGSHNCNNEVLMSKWWRGLWGNTETNLPPIMCTFYLPIAWPGSSGRFILHKVYSRLNYCHLKHSCLSSMSSWWSLTNIESDTSRFFSGFLGRFVQWKLGFWHKLWVIWSFFAASWISG